MSLPAGPAHRQLAVDRNGELHDSAAIESAPASLVAPLRCADCGAPLEAVRAHPRRERAGIVHVAAHYRLAPGAAHTTTCPWLASPTSPAPSARPGSEPKAAPRMYSLVVAGSSSMRTPVWRSRSFRHRQLPPLNSAATVADILTRHGDEAAAITLEYRGRTIRWRDFLFPCSDAERLGQALQQGSPGHPVAVVGHLGNLVVTRSGRTSLAVLTDSFGSAAERPRGPRIVVRTSRSPLIEDNHMNRLAVALGWWQLHRHTGPGHVEHEVVLWINRRWQISSWSPAE